MEHAMSTPDYYHVAPLDIFNSELTDYTFNNMFGWNAIQICDFLEGFIHPGFYALLGANVSYERNGPWKNWQNDKAGADEPKGGWETYFKRMKRLKLIASLPNSKDVTKIVDGSDRAMLRALTLLAHLIIDLSPDQTSRRTMGYWKEDWSKRRYFTTIADNSKGHAVIRLGNKVDTNYAQTFGMIVDLEHNLLRYHNIGSADAEAKKEVGSPYFLMGDLLGLFLSTLVNAQLAGITGTRANVCLPFLTLYNRWIMAFAGSVPVNMRRGEIGARSLKPAMTQITWLEDGGKCTFVAFGQSVRGTYDLAEDHELKISVRRQRFSLLLSKHGPQVWNAIIAEARRQAEGHSYRTGKPANLDVIEKIVIEKLSLMSKGEFCYNTSPNSMHNFLDFADFVESNWTETEKCDLGSLPSFLYKSHADREKTLKTGETWLTSNNVGFEGMNNRGTKLGNCAETYPFLSLLSPLQRSRQLARDANGSSKLHGIAMVPDAAFPNGWIPETLYEARNFALRDVMFDPCFNCKFLINRLFGFPEAEANFTFGGNENLKYNFLNRDGVQLQRP